MTEPGKFQACADREVGARLYAEMLNGCCDEQVSFAGDWFGLLADTILVEDQQGFFDYSIYESEARARQEWTHFMGIVALWESGRHTDDG